MNYLPLTVILSSPVAIQAIYFASCLVIALAGVNKKMGFWGYLFCSIIFSPLIGLMVVLVSEKTKKEETA
ncbi:hypothetical protein [Desulfonema magnum]|uniref:Uncharacterized protein n=1 Tax=Desulfonema magnum TaxID=45655 RepID=A0A975BMU5_9BACT|nr:hypothetical protein [Desulfonema magnum]QTA87805.1 Uncharacterized protein dnm_038420 [Desulfonema magnum]